ncbi:MAG: glycosyltransferase family 9 protein, partial [Bdellovibrionales bacterium]|nr:glycosyltransferase family 9 protein [Bdellovibrionales bacterium]
RKAETQLMVEALELGPFQRDEYIVQLTLTELQEVRRRRSLWSGDRKAPLVGINTGCAGTIPAKKLSIEGHRMLIRQLTKKFPHCKIVLLGGPEDDQRNRTIGKNLPVIQSPYCSGLRDGIVSVAACDLVISGDSLGMHMSIALKKWIVAWFGPTCDHEIDIYDRGVKVLADVNCSPCWKRSCDATVMCYDRVNFETVCEGVEKGLQWLISSSKPHFWEISS